MPVQPLPSRPDLEHLKGQASDLLEGCARRDARACQRLREFHPRFSDSSDPQISAAKLAWSDGLLAIAREYGYATWARLKAHVSAGAPRSEATLRDRIADLPLRQAVDALDDGDADELRRLLSAHPDLLSRRAHFEGENYFRTPALLAFVAENPVRHGGLPPNIVEIARLLLEQGAAKHRGDVEETLGLIVSGRVVREAGVQSEMIELLVHHGASPAGAMDAALTHGEFAAVSKLVALGAPKSLAFAAATGELPTALSRLPLADAKERHLAVALAAQHGRVEVLSLLLDAGEDPNRFNPAGAHAHSTPLHQAAWHGHEAVVKMLVGRGADRHIQDTLWNGTPAVWARHAGRMEIAEWLEGTS